MDKIFSIGVLYQTVWKTVKKAGIQLPIPA